MKRSLFIFGLLISFSSNTFGQYNIWGRSIGGTSTDVARSIAVDKKGNTYITGFFYDTVDFDPGPGVVNLIATPGGAFPQDMFVAKYNPAGNLVWARAMGGDNIDQGWAIAVDISGNVYTAGGFTGLADFDPGPAVFNLTSAGMADIVLSKLDSFGNFVWAKRIGGTLSDVPFDVGFDGFGHVYMTGNFKGTIDFDPGPGVFNVTAAGNNDIYILKLSTAGNFIWAKTMGGVGDDGATAITFDKLGNVYTCGVFNDTCDFDPGPAVYNVSTPGVSYGFISKLDSSGNFAWVRTMGGTNAVGPYGIALDSSGNIYTAGAFTMTADFNPGPGVFNLTSTSGNDGYVCKLNAAGNFVWAKAFAGLPSSDDGCYSLALDDSANVYTAGSFSIGVDLDPGSGTYNLVSAGSVDIFVSKLDSSGNFKWARGIGGTGIELSEGLALDPLHNVYIAGSFYGSFDINQASGVYNLASVGGADMFWERMAQCTFSFTITKAGNVLTAPSGYSSYQWYRNDIAIIWATNDTYTATQPGNYYVVAANPNGCVGQSPTLVVTSVENVGIYKSLALYPNPTSGKFTLDVEIPARVKGLTVTVVNYIGVKVHEEIFSDAAGKFARELDLRAMAKGVYLVEVKTELGRVTKKLLLQ
jgi:hypothetical protein